MEADWEIEIGGGAPVIEALWPGFVDLRQSPERIGEIAEAAEFPALAHLLKTLNGADSPLWTSKCDLWEPEAAGMGIIPAVASSETDCQELVQSDSANLEVIPSGSTRAALACYIDLIPVKGKVFADWQQAERFCKEWIARLGQFQSSISPLDLDQLSEDSVESGVEMIVRQAIAGTEEGFGVTAYLRAIGRNKAPVSVEAALISAMRDFAATIPTTVPPATETSKLQ
jgi:hypothetical protein